MIVRASLFWRLPGARAAMPLAVALGVWASSAPGQPTPSNIPLAEPPRYELEARLEPRQGLLTGTLKVALPPGDSRAADALWFHLPPNRFARPDHRGMRRHLAAIPFGISFIDPPMEDPWLPDGFSEGSLEVLSATGPNGAALAVSWADNPALPVGYSTWRGLLRVEDSGGAPLRSLTLRFRTRLPRRLVEGRSDLGWVLEHWHPVLANHSGGGWDFDVHRPRPGTYSARIETSEAGWIATGRGTIAWTPANGQVVVPGHPSAEKSFPLAYIPGGILTRSREGDAPVAFLAQSDGQALGVLTHQLAAAWFEYHARELALPAPSPGLIVLQGDLPPDETITLGNLIVVSRAYAHNPPLLDRVYADALARALGQVWFGETVWNDNEREAWLRLGFSGYLALRFFEARYGWDSRMHPTVDWLSPRHREHHFEAPVRALMRAQNDAPLLIPLSGYPTARVALTVLHRKAPLVLRMLDYALGGRRFEAALLAFFRAHLHRAATHDDWQAGVNRDAGENMDWFFDQWFHGATRVDYGVGPWREEMLADGRWRLTVAILRKAPGIMPIEIEVSARNGQTARQRIGGRQESESVEFLLSSRPETITLDPEEFLLEEDRRNNHSSILFRIRPFFDWGKQREILMNLVAQAGGNAVDGNYAGLGASIQLDEDNTLQVVPYYGERTGIGNFYASWMRGHIFHPRLSLLIQARRLGGSAYASAAMEYQYVMPDHASMNTNTTLRIEQMEPISATGGDRNRTQSAGEANNASLLHTADRQWNRQSASGMVMSLERGSPLFGGKFDYSIVDLRLAQVFEPTPRHRFRFEALGVAASPETPLQKQPLLGDPLALRGYPRDFALVYENIAAVRMDYRLTLSRRVWGEFVQVRRVMASLFADVGQGWDSASAPIRSPLRQDVGVGLEFHINTAGLVSFPVRIEIAYPVNDSQYTAPQVVLFQALSFF